MRISTFTFNISIVILLICFQSFSIDAQTDSTKFIQRIPADTSQQKLNMDAVYNRPFLSAGKLPVAIGGYLEANTDYRSTDGITEGLSFQARRFTLFLSSTIAQRIKFLSEIEFEDGTKEIHIEFAAMDLEFHPLFNLRAGIVMNPIGAFNQNHDGPRWDFVDRPISATTIIPSTLSNVGFGIHGKYFYQRWILGYEAYLTNGFDDDIISNSMNRTSLAEGKDEKRFEESNSGLPMFSGKVAIRNRNIGELGLSYMTGVYNKWRNDGLIVDEKRSASVFAIDFNTTLFNNRLDIKGEISKVWVEIPDTYSQAFGSEQIGGYLDVIGTIVQKPMLGWSNAKINLGFRLEYADYNQGTFNETGGEIGDHIWAFVPTLSFRPVGTTVVRLNYRFHQETDLLGNPPANTGIIQVGFSTYF
ncbi:MAG: hypothetical protein IPI60_03470 [Saprospiraceae bacterium]|jgi:hypothetical protein|nr:hypothetical protein [Saprospiraceae bacterium]